ncbi:MAG: hypothetical protein B7Y54_12990 [Polaromonas sp. 35-63-240]|nr:MAG: hypothetical protein B7Y54_12990 [Polaromonas sp. 35-63-240]
MRGRRTGAGSGGRCAVGGHPAGSQNRPAASAFARLFFGIWLSPNTSEPQLREALLAGAAG